MGNRKHLGSAEEGVVALVRERLRELMAKSFAELAGLPPQSQQEVTLGDKKVAVSIWHDKLPTSEHRIVVQIYQSRVLGTGQMCADGFAVNERMETRNRSVGEWAPFS